jgi:hypothetical protein
MYIVVRLKDRRCLNGYFGSPALEMRYCSGMLLEVKMTADEGAGSAKHVTVQARLDELLLRSGPTVFDLEW